MIRHERSARPAVILLSLTAALLATAPPSRASELAALPGSHWGGGDQHNGNGSHNRVSAPFNSPNFNNGAQTVINANSGGTTLNQLQLCKWRIHCRLSQRAHLINRWP